MIFKLQYQNDTEKQSVLDANKDKIFIEEHNLIEGNFLVFTDTPRPEEQVNSIKNDIDWLVLRQKGLV